MMEHAVCECSKPDCTGIHPQDVEHVIVMAGTECIRLERQRQMEVKGWTKEHDQTHDKSEILKAAVCYALEALDKTNNDKVVIGHYWPWLNSDWKPSPEPIRNLVKAGALIAAEIDRLQGKRILEGNYEP